MSPRSKHPEVGQYGKRCQRRSALVIWLSNICIRNPNDPCFGWKRPCFVALTFKNRGHWVPGSYSSKHLRSSTENLGELMQCNYELPLHSFFLEKILLNTVFKHDLISHICSDGRTPTRKNIHCSWLTRGWGQILWRCKRGE